MIVAGLDLSLTGTGVALVDTRHATMPVYFVEGSPPPADAPGYDRASVADRAERLAVLADRILADLLLLPLDLAVLEGPAMHSRHGQPHERGGLWWMVADGLRVRGVPLAEVAPTARAQYATGAGNAAKASVLAASVAAYQLRTRDHNVADAVILAAMGARYLGEPIERHHLNPRQIGALDRALWPVLDSTTKGIS